MMSMQPFECSPCIAEPETRKLWLSPLAITPPTDASTISLAESGSISDSSCHSIHCSHRSEQSPNLAAQLQHTEAALCAVRAVSSAILAAELRLREKAEARVLELEQVIAAQRPQSFPLLGDAVQQGLHRTSKLGITQCQMQGTSISKVGKSRGLGVAKRVTPARLAQSGSCRVASVVSTNRQATSFPGRAICSSASGKLGDDDETSDRRFTKLHQWICAGRPNGTNARVASNIREQQRRSISFPNRIASDAMSSRPTTVRARSVTDFARPGGNSIRRCLDFEDLS